MQRGRRWCEQRPRQCGRRCEVRETEGGASGSGLRERGERSANAFSGDRFSGCDRRCCDTARTPSPLHHLSAMVSAAAVAVLLLALAALYVLLLMLRQLCPQSKHKSVGTAAASTQRMQRWMRNRGEHEATPGMARSGCNHRRRRRPLSVSTVVHSPSEADQHEADSGTMSGGESECERDRSSDSACLAPIRSSTRLSPLTVLHLFGFESAPFCCCCVLDTRAAWTSRVVTLASAS